METKPVYEGTGDSIESALNSAHSQIRIRHGRDFTISRVIEWGQQFGGFAAATLYYVKVIEDEHSPFKT